MPFRNVRLFANKPFFSMRLSMRRPAPPSPGRLPEKSVFRRNLGGRDTWGGATARSQAGREGGRVRSAGLGRESQNAGNSHFSGETGSERYRKSRFGKSVRTSSPNAAHVLALPYLRHFTWIEGRRTTPAPRTPRLFANYAINPGKLDRASHRSSRRDRPYG
jgi:hypothetical protein